MGSGFYAGKDGKPVKGSSKVDKMSSSTIEVHKPKVILVKDSVYMLVLVR